MNMTAVDEAARVVSKAEAAYRREERRTGMLLALMGAVAVVCGLFALMEARELLANTGGMQ